MLDTTETAVKGALQRARATLERSRPARDLVEAGSAEERGLSERFAAAFVARDIDALLGLLTDDAWLAMPPAPNEYHGPAAIAGFLQFGVGAATAPLVGALGNTGLAMAAVMTGSLLGALASLLFLVRSADLVASETAAEPAVALAAGRARDRRARAQRPGGLSHSGCAGR